MFNKILTGLTLFFLFTKPILANSNIEIAEEFFLEGDYENALKIIDPMLEKLEDLNKNKKSNLLALKIRLTNLKQQNQEMKQWMEKLYLIDPNFEWDYYTDPPQIFHHWKTIKEAHLHNDKKDKNIVDRFNENYYDKDLKKASKFWVGISPFGIGHIDTQKYGKAVGFFLTDGISFSYLLKPSEGSEEQTKNAKTIAGLLFLSSWSYEIVSLTPELANRDPGKTEVVRKTMVFAPYGAAQAKNGHWGKAVVLGSTQALFTSLMLTENTHTFRVGLSGFAISYLYGVYDSWFYHENIEEEKSTNFSFHLTPVWQKTKNEEDRFGILSSVKFEW